MDVPNDLITPTDPPFTPTEQPHQPEVSIYPDAPTDPPSNPKPMGIETFQKK
jgi:hypothetical protein